MYKFSKTNFFLNSVARTFIAYILLFVFVFTGLSVILNVQSYKIKVASDIEDNLLSYENSQIPVILDIFSMGLDEFLVKEVEAIHELRFVEYVEIIRGTEVIAHAGNHSVKENLSDPKYIVHHSPLRSLDSSQAEILGELLVVASMDNIYADMDATNFSIIIVQIVQTFFLSFLLIYLFYRLVGKHLITISHYANELTLGKLEKPLKLLRKTTDVNCNDEISHLSKSINDMRINLKRSFDRNLRTELEREKLLNQMQEKNAELERFNYTVSHDLKSPLVTINGYIGMLEEDINNGDKEAIREDISTIKNAASTMYNLLSDLLELSRIGLKQGERKETNFNDLIDEVLSVLAGQINLTQALINVEESLPLAQVEVARFKEVFLNLIENSLKYKDKETIPLIEIGTKLIKDKTGKSEIAFFVKDNGIGINPDYCNKIFELFERIEVSVEGTGVGLAIVSRIIEIHDGRIWMESDGEGMGTTFYFIIPLIET